MSYLNKSSIALLLSTALALPHQGFAAQPAPEEEILLPADTTDEVRLEDDTRGFSNPSHMPTRAPVRTVTIRHNLHVLGETTLDNNTTVNGDLTVTGDLIGGEVKSDANNNTAAGTDALASLTTGYDNTAVGYQGLYANTAGYENTAAGSQTLRNNIDGDSNSAFGYLALYANTSGNNNTATGSHALYSNKGSTYYNSAFGYRSLYEVSGERIKNIK